MLGIKLFNTILIVGLILLIFWKKLFPPVVSSEEDEEDNSPTSTPSNSDDEGGDGGQPAPGSYPGAYEPTEPVIPDPNSPGGNEPVTDDWWDSDDTWA